MLFKCKTAKILAFNDLIGVNIMKATRAVDFMKPLIGLILLSIEDHLILLLSCYVKYQIKIIMRKKKKKYLINEVLEKFNRT